MAKVFVITGAGSGLGRTFAKTFAADGHNIVLLGRTLKKLQNVADEIGERALPIACDVSSPDSVRAAFAEIEKRFGKIDVLINNAAYVAHGKLVESSDAEIFDSYNTCSIGPVLCCRSAIPLMESGAHIINISSGAVDNNYPTMSIYASAKAALERFSAMLFDELQPDGIRVTAVRCGQMVEEIGKWDLDPEMAELMEKAIANGMDPRKRPSSTFASVANALRDLVNYPGDLQTPLLVLKPRAAE